MHWTRSRLETRRPDMGPGAVLDKNPGWTRPENIFFLAESPFDRKPRLSWAKII
eukprot:m.391418 g.391418  ORF g.391418 m.391418 type:complete len:54 (-) comp16759_c7_seq2:896-1057(-)